MCFRVMSRGVSKEIIGRVQFLSTCRTRQRHVSAVWTACRVLVTGRTFMNSCSSGACDGLSTLVIVVRTHPTTKFMTHLQVIAVDVPRQCCV